MKMLRKIIVLIEKNRCYFIVSLQCKEGDSTINKLKDFF